MADRRRRRDSEHSESECSEDEEPPKQKTEQTKRDIQESECESEAGVIVEDLSEYESANETNEEGDDEDEDETTDDSEDDDEETTEYEEDSILEGDYEDGFFEEERQSGDGEEQPDRSKDLDDDEDRKNPAYIPRRGAFYEHDVRMDETESKDKDEEQRPKKMLWKDEGKWHHDKFDTIMQSPKTDEELIALYGYDIRAHDRPPPAPKRRPRGRGGGQYRHTRLSDFIDDKRSSPFPGQDGSGDYINNRFPGQDFGRDVHYNQDKFPHQGKENSPNNSRERLSNQEQERLSPREKGSLSKEVRDSYSNQDRSRHAFQDRASYNNDTHDNFSNQDNDRFSGRRTFPPYNNRFSNQDVGDRYTGQDTRKFPNRGSPPLRTRGWGGRRGRGVRGARINRFPNEGPPRKGFNSNNRNSSEQYNRSHYHQSKPYLDKYTDDDFISSEFADGDLENITRTITTITTGPGDSQLSDHGPADNGVHQERKSYQRDRKARESKIGKPRVADDASYGREVEKKMKDLNISSDDNSPEAKRESTTNLVSRKETTAPPVISGSNNRPKEWKGGFPPAPVVSKSEVTQQPRPKRYSSQRQRNLPEATFQEHVVDSTAAPPVSVANRSPGGTTYFRPVFPPPPVFHPRAEQSPPQSVSSFPPRPTLIQQPMAYPLPGTTQIAPSTRMYAPVPSTMSPTSVATGPAAIIQAPFVTAPVVTYSPPQPPQQPPHAYQITPHVSIPFAVTQPPPPQPDVVQVRGGTTYFSPEVQPMMVGRAPCRRVKVAIPIVNPQEITSGNAEMGMTEYRLEDGEMYTEEDFYETEKIDGEDGVEYDYEQYGWSNPSVENVDEFVDASNDLADNASQSVPSDEKPSAYDTKLEFTRDNTDDPDVTAATTCKAQKETEPVAARHTKAESEINAKITEQTCLPDRTSPAQTEDFTTTETNLSLSQDETCDRVPVEPVAHMVDGAVESDQPAPDGGESPAH